MQQDVGVGVEKETYDAIEGTLRYDEEGSSGCNSQRSSQSTALSVDEKGCA